MGKHRLNKKDGIAPVVSQSNSYLYTYIKAKIFSMEKKATGNWGCGRISQGDVQLKLVIQWMAASLAGVPVLIYNTSGHEKLTKVSITRSARAIIEMQYTS